MWRIAAVSLKQPLNATAGANRESKASVQLEGPLLPFTTKLSWAEVVADLLQHPGMVRTAGLPYSVCQRA
ncbi:hypothetical protein OEZ86_001326 [Tetradesmus obliquus]|nr:hypothetical protein OEZ86_001326 [Tetradesmus obliquus]